MFMFSALPKKIYICTLLQKRTDYIIGHFAENGVSLVYWKRQNSQPPPEKDCGMKNLPANLLC